MLARSPAARSSAPVDHYQEPCPPAPPPGRLVCSGAQVQNWAGLSLRVSEGPPTSLAVEGRSVIGWSGKSGLVAGRGACGELARASSPLD